MPFDLNIETLFLVVAAVAVISIVTAIWLAFLAHKLNRLLGGTNAKNIEQSLSAVHADLADFKNFRSELEQYLETVEHRLKQSVQSIETVRFNPFKGTGDGGNQSFSTAFINEQGDGVVVSSLYSRERISIFSKAIKNFNSEFELTEEEREVIQNAEKKLWKKSQEKRIRL